jgi:hypothetical protein
MIILKRLAPTATFAACAFFLVEPAGALPPISQPNLFSSLESATAAQPVKQRRCYGYRDGRRVYRSCPPRRHQAKRQPGRYGASQNTGYYKPWTGIQLCENCPAK